MGANERVIFFFAVVGFVFVALVFVCLFLLAQYGIEVLLPCLGWHQNSSNKKSSIVHTQS